MTVAYQNQTYDPQAFDYSLYANDDYAADISTGGRSDRFSAFGNFIFRDDVADRLGELFYTKLDVKPIKFMLRGRPDPYIGVAPAITVDPTRPTTGPETSLYRCTVVAQVKIASFLGPKTDMCKGGLSFIDGYSPEDRRGMAPGELPPTIFTTLNMRAPMIVEQPQYARFKRFYTPPTRGGDEYGSESYKYIWLRPSRVAYYASVRVFETPQFEEADCNFAYPLDGLLPLAQSAYKSLLTCMTRTREGWNGDGLTHEQLASRACIVDRFGFDACDPAGAPIFMLEGSKPKKRAETAQPGRARFRSGGGDGGGGGESGGRAFGAQYTVKIDPQYPRMYLSGDEQTTLETVRDTYVSPGEYLNFMSQIDIANTILDRSSDPEWSEFIILCLRGTNLYEGIRERGDRFLKDAEAMRTHLDNASYGPYQVQGQRPYQPPQQYPQGQYVQNQQYAPPAAGLPGGAQAHVPQSFGPPAPQQYGGPAPQGFGPAPAQQQQQQMAPHQPAQAPGGLMPQQAFGAPPAPAQGYTTPPPPPGQQPRRATPAPAPAPAHAPAPAPGGMMPNQSFGPRPAPMPGVDAAYTPPPAPPPPPANTGFVAHDPTQPIQAGAPFDDSALDIFRNFGSDQATGDIPF